MTKGCEQELTDHLNSGSIIQAAYSSHTKKRAMPGHTYGTKSVETENLLVYLTKTHPGQCRYSRNWVSSKRYWIGATTSNHKITRKIWVLKRIHKEDENTSKLEGKERRKVQRYVK